MTVPEFKINDYLTLRLVGDETTVYVNGESFLLCKRLLLNIPVKNLEDLEELDSIDEAAMKLGWEGEEQVYDEEVEYDLSAEVEFWGHCSNLQAWYENAYDTRLLHSNIAFYLLKKLSDVGDLLAREVFKKEVSKRLNSGYDPVVYYLVNSRYTEHLSRDELLFSILESSEAEILLELEDMLGREFHIDDSTELLDDVDCSLSFENRHVIRLQLFGLYLKELPDCIRSLRYLRYLYIRGNEFEGLPRWLKELGNLEVMDLSVCELEVFPEEIMEVESLKHLKLEYNYIPELPESIDKLNRLEKLDINSSDFSLLPSSIGNLRSLKIFYGGHNDIHELPETIGNLDSLEELYLGSNKLVDLPESIGRLSNLKILELGGNYFKELPDSIGSLFNLKKLLISSSNLRSIPRTISNLKNLEVLDIWSYNLEEIPLEIFELPNLKEIRFSRSVLKNIPKSIIRELKMRKVKVKD